MRSASPRLPATFRKTTSVRPAGSDSVNAEAQDGSGTDNANFATPSDGSNPRMQMYLWNGGPDHEVFASGASLQGAARRRLARPLPTGGDTGQLGARRRPADCLRGRQQALRRQGRYCRPRRLRLRRQSAERPERRRDCRRSWSTPTRTTCSRWAGTAGRSGFRPSWSAQSSGAALTALAAAPRRAAQALDGATS